MLPELRKLCCSVPKHKYLKVKRKAAFFLFTISTCWFSKTLNPALNKGWNTRKRDSIKNMNGEPAKLLYPFPRHSRQVVAGRLILDLR